MKRFQACLLSLVLACVMNTSTVLAADAYEGYQLFNTYCMLCHGVSGKGDGPLASKLGGAIPANLTDAQRIGKRSDKELFQIIQGTRDHAMIGDEMPRWGMAISSPQIKSLVSYIRFLSGSKYPLIGEPELGRQVYLKSCAACHGARGMGDGVMTNVLKMEPADHTSSGKMAKMSNGQLLKVVREGGKSYMPAWGGILSEQEIQSVVGYIRLLSY